MDMSQIRRQSFVYLLLLVIFESSSATRPRYAAYKDDQNEVLETWGKFRLNQCVGAAGKCYSTQHCCKGLVCAAFDDYHGTNPEIPGYCVREKDLQECLSSYDCKPDCKCIELKRSGGLRYCLPLAIVNEQAYSKKLALKQYSIRNKISGGLGSACDRDSDCSLTTDDNTSTLCCQIVRRGRQLAKQMCDRVTSISVCIP